MIPSVRMQRNFIPKHAGAGKRLSMPNAWLSHGHASHVYPRLACTNSAVTESIFSHLAVHTSRFSSSEGSLQPDQIKKCTHTGARFSFSPGPQYRVRKNTALAKWRIVNVSKALKKGSPTKKRTGEKENHSGERLTSERRVIAQKTSHNRPETNTKTK
ncbi:hypothetical protein VFPPC_18768 [Pochonia chlamydosporia 170]|uniref:Uncharacterized protein n=1 Tax=Pochonia chlamydosporia 170 TaxID=1380566 RepID=A0A219ATJ0_METCM|nr:hypothetical protein VFPPC_18768 [Pochonia chlamydosporia 170]OWT43505.1 hypothetical protein VFPPC_18768 [Pochonia chlamydosporia 170]